MMLRTLAVMALAMWPLIPIFFIPLHLKTGFWRKVGLLTYPILLVPWFIAAYFIIVYQSLLLGNMFMVPVFLRIVGWVSLIAGLLFHIWTAKLLGLKGLIGYAEIRPAKEFKYELITSGPFSVVRHPSYLAHTLLLLGVFLITGYLGTGILVILDFLISYFVITRLEEKELNQRFGEKYQKYRREVPRFFPGFKFYMVNYNLLQMVVKAYFNFRYTMKSDPYRINESEYEQIKIAKSIEKIKEQKFPSVLEIGCGGGYHTELLLPFSGRMLCIDSSSAALKRAKEIISDDRVAFKQLDLVTDDLKEKFDLIFCSEVLYYLGLEQLHSVSAKIINWLRAGGTLVLVHARLENNWYERFILKRPGARIIHNLFIESDNLYSTYDMNEEFYRITILKKLCE